jgi:spore coat polysaccharide biosynthesis protein SpsF
MKNKKKVTVMIQTRTGSTRLPKKSLALIEKKPMIWHVVNRVKEIRNVDQIALITTRKKTDKILLDLAKKYGIIGYAGDVNDLLNRHFQCAIKIEADPIIRITSDCPLIDPKIVEKVLKFYLDHDYDYVSNIIEPSFPDGQDVEVFSLNALKKAVKNAKLSSEREHVSPYFTKKQNKFKLYNIKNEKDLSHMRWTVDQKQDLTFVRKIYSKMKPKTVFSIKEILRIISEEPELQNINKGIKRNEGYVKSLKNDHILHQK